MRGWLCRGKVAATGERGLLAAVLVQALKDAERGAPDAQDWLSGIGAELAEQFLGLPAAAVRAWPGADLRPLGGRSARGGRRPAADARAAARREQDRLRKRRSRAAAGDATVAAM